MATVTFTVSAAAFTRVKNAVLNSGYQQQNGETDPAFVRRWMIDQVVTFVRQQEAVIAAQNAGTAVTPDYTLIT